MIFLLWKQRAAEERLNPRQCPSVPRQGNLDFLTALLVSLPGRNLAMARLLLLLLSASYLHTALNTTMGSPSIIPSAVPTAGLEDKRDQRNPSLLNLGAMVGMVLAKVVVIIPLYGWMIFLWWKQRPAA
ncbi:paired immunoglobulin-like type 2 receptor beta-2 isoform X3 [Rattus norvegicus]|uniref:paired immunoglobulin-like type 2 receptor beta-2 isoform X3 n=1 Tax=Rattus norvegicus TaxID=10116 RepID=UPI002FD876D1